MRVRPPAPQLGLWPATALVVGHTIAVGIFLTPAELIGALASPALTFGLWIVCGGLVLAGALTFGELAARFPQAGGPYVYLREGWGDRIAFLFGWQSLLIMDPGVTAALATGASQYAVLLWPAFVGAERRIAVGLIWILAAISMAGFTLSARLLSAMTAFKVAALVGIALAAFAVGRGSWSHFVPFAPERAGAPPLPEALALALVSIFFSFGGFWEASRIAGDVRDPSRTMPRALVAGVACVTAVYLVTSLAFLYLVPAREATTASEFARRAGQALLGARGPSALASVVLLSVISSAMALLIMAPRLYVAMSLDGVFPSAVASLHPTAGTPVRATALLAVLASAFALVGTFQEIVAFFMCTTLGFIALAAAALVVVRRRTAGPDAFRSPGYPASTLSFVVLVLAVVTLVAVSRPVQAALGFALVLIGVPVHARLFPTRQS